MTSAIAVIEARIVPARCGPHQPYVDLRFHARMRPTDKHLPFDAAFNSGRMVVWYDCARCGAAFYFGVGGIGAFCTLPAR